MDQSVVHCLQILSADAAENRDSFFEGEFFVVDGSTTTNDSSLLFVSSCAALVIIYILLIDAGVHVTHRKWPEKLVSPT